MNTGICKPLALCVVAALAGCGDVEGLGFLSEGIAGNALGPKPFTQVEMVQGAITLVPPAGFCVDPKSVTQRFAIMARCDVLGGRGGALDAPLGLITMSAEKAGNGSVTAQILSGNIKNGRVLDDRRLGEVTYLRVQSDAPSDGVSDVHWRTVDQINGYDVALALYAPEGSAALGADGPRILRRLLEGSEGASVAKDVAVRTLRPKAKPKKLF